MVSGCAKYSVGGSMIPGDISAATLWRKVIDYEERILSVKGQNLKGISGG
jgi:hypothetical protein